MVEYKLVKLISSKQVVDGDGNAWKERDIVKAGKGEDGADRYMSIATDRAEKPWDTRRWLEMMVLSGEYWNAPIARRRAASRIVDAVVSAADTDKDVVKIRTEDHRLVKDFIEGEDFVVPSPHGRQLYCFEDAWLDASDCKMSSDKK